MLQVHFVPVGGWQSAFTPFLTTMYLPLVIQPNRPKQMALDE
jgi:hypothetical protein